MNNATDIILIEQVVRGDERALREIIERYRERLYRLAYSLLGDGGAEDAVQETFIVLWKRAWKYDTRHSLSTWLYTICCRECYDEMRRRRRRGKAVGEMPRPEAYTDGLEADELVELLRWATSQLPPKQRIVYQLREVEGLSTEETLLITKMTPEQVKANLWAARQAVQKKLRNHGIQ